jgi:hypothetical protein
MTIIVEDGTIVAGANSYVTEAELTAYATARGVTLTAGTEQLLIESMDYIESQSFIGTKKTADQPLQWPREGVYIDGYYVESDVIPNDLKTAQLATATAIDQGNGPQNVLSAAVKREKVDVIEVEYQDGAMSGTIDPKINASLKKLISGGGNIYNFNVSRY